MSSYSQICVDSGRGPLAGKVSGAQADNHSNSIRNQFLANRRSKKLGRAESSEGRVRRRSFVGGGGGHALGVGGGSITADTSQLTVKELLNEVFPSHVAKALMEGRKVEPESKECVTIFFSDIVGYTELGSSMEAHLVMNMLDR